ncbi:hypothetical protein [Zavarzinella formosa]|uniref:hypothetical protein n=1 Tax=Zavarzinella formosa TaxID=360055 RepID=UPI0002E9753C|nr:hypothetical protein [Zavarzinella formosa]
MTRLILTALLFGVLALPVSAADPTPEELKKSIDDLKKVTDDLKKLKDAMNKLEELRSKSIIFETQLELIEKDIKDMKKKLGMDGSTPNTSLKPSDSTSAFKGQGRVRFINQFSEEMSVVVNGRSYRLLPGDEKLVPVPPGEFSYQVLQLQRAPQDRLIAADETKTVTIYPIK